LEAAQAAGAEQQLLKTFEVEIIARGAEKKPAKEEAHYDVYIPSPPTLKERFEALQLRFWQVYCSDIFPPTTPYSSTRPTRKIVPVQASESIMKAALNQCSKNVISWNGRNCRPFSLTFHGTAVHNFSKIANKGFLIPGNGGVNIANGSAHGVGIYSSTSLYSAMGYSSARRIFVCGILDQLGDVTRPCGHMRVAFKHNLIFPFFELSE
jgi:hypothetical protein